MREAWFGSSVESGWREGKFLMVLAVGREGGVETGEILLGNQLPAEAACLL